MFTVCPKCALTLVVTAADLRVAQGYVRCGRCSNVFNALSRLSEDRQAAAAQPQSSSQPAPAPKAAQPTAPQQQRNDNSAALRTPSAAQQAATPAPAPPPSEPQRYDDDSAIPEEDLEFNPDGTDLNKVFVEQAPSPQFTAATGTFNAIRLEAESSAHSNDLLAETDEREGLSKSGFDPSDTQVDVEIDPDLLATMAQMPAKGPANPTLAEPPQWEAVHREPSPPAQKPPAPEAARPKPVPAPPKQQLPLQPSLDQLPQTPPMRLAERAKARADAARTGADATRTSALPKAETKQKPQTRQKPEPVESAPRADLHHDSALETTQAIRAALAPRKRTGPGAASPAAEPTSMFAGMWTAGCVALLVLLLVQIVHHYRHDLAANPTLNGPLTGLYAALGIPLVPRWDLEAYEVRQLGASTAGAGQIRVLASVKNVGHQAQPLPLLRVTLQDRFGNHIASRDVPPRSYLPRAIPSTSLLSAGQRIDAEMTFMDPGSNAVGFEIDACLPAPGGGISCANDSTR